MLNLFPEIKPYHTEYLQVDPIHRIFFTLSGNPAGQPVIYVHGGPGCGCSAIAKRFFDPQYYHIITVDQRGCGQSTPFLEIRNNTTADLASDMEKIRQYLSIDKWIVHGGSWGTTLSLYYAENYPEAVDALVLRGIFLGRDEDIKWLYQGGAGQFFPEAYSAFTSLLPANCSDNIAYYYQKLTNGNDEDLMKYGKAFSTFENSVTTLKPKVINSDITPLDLAMARMECHYFVNHCFMPENYILNNVHRIVSIPTFIVHGRYDVDCRPEGAYLLAQKLPSAKLIFTISGHSSMEPEIIDQLIRIQKEMQR